MAREKAHRSESLGCPPGVAVLPACWPCRRFLFAGILSFAPRSRWLRPFCIACCLLMYLSLISGALIESLMRPLQTLSNVVSSLREGDYSFRARGASSRDPLGELAAEINALADLLQKQRVRSLEATALLARILEVMHAPLFAFDRENVLQLVNNAGTQLLQRPYARCFGHSAARTRPGRAARRARPVDSLVRRQARALAAAQGDLPPGRRAAHAASARRCEPAACRKKSRPRGNA